jgi:hypothetical protein
MGGRPATVGDDCSRLRFQPGIARRPPKRPRAMPPNKLRAWQSADSPLPCAVTPGCTSGERLAECSPGPFGPRPPNGDTSR